MSLFNYFPRWSSLPTKTFSEDARENELPSEWFSRQAVNLEEKNSRTCNKVAFPILPRYKLLPKYERMMQMDAEPETEGRNDVEEVVVTWKHP